MRFGYPDDWEDDRDDDRDDDREAVCNRCGADGLRWINTGERWRLFDEDNRPHVCALPDDAPDLTDVA